ncbi:hypothetical protein [Komagataeibacter diospyri]|uniref:hypothetical protein n=1 Tax=Komagataeibacter diospyri TaxID=1932662 RepID=UPI0037584011
MAVSPIAGTAITGKPRRKGGIRNRQEYDANVMIAASGLSWPLLKTFMQIVHRSAISNHVPGVYSNGDTLYKSLLSITTSNATGAMPIAQRDFHVTISGSGVFYCYRLPDASY